MRQTQLRENKNLPPREFSALDTRNKYSSQFLLLLVFIVPIVHLNQVYNNNHAIMRDADTTSAKINQRGKKSKPDRA